MSDYVIGANILENLTTGMYQDSKVVFREYIQNACDQIDKALRQGILGPGEGAIHIWTELNNRTICIEDNATGIPADRFRDTLGNIADSDKKIGEDKGFRGIGRLCGLAYCSELVFESSAKGETVESRMICDAEKMRELLSENGRGRKYTANEVLHAINRFEIKDGIDPDSHYFRVILRGINKENTELLESSHVKDYLSFVAPVPYQSQFLYRGKIYEHAESLGVRLDEYQVMVNGESIFKKYTSVLKDTGGIDKYDDIWDVYCQDFFDSKGFLIAWMWVGVSSFKKAIPKVNLMRGLRLRKDNIQIGGEDALQDLFKEDRGNSYFVGEVHAVSRELIPNSQRNYFNENPARAEFERVLKKFFNDELHKTYYTGSSVNSACKKFQSYERLAAEFEHKEASGLFVDSEHRERELAIVDELRTEADKARQQIDKLREKCAASDLVKAVLDRVEKIPARPIDGRLPCDGRVATAEEPSDKPKMQRRVDRLSKLNKAERKLVSRIFNLITKATDRDTADKIICAIEEEYK